MSDHKKTTSFSAAGSGDMLADRRFAMARDWARDGDWHAAADLMAQAREIAPDWPPGAFEHGVMLAAAGRLDDAAAAFAAYLALDPADTMGAGIKLALHGLRPAPDTLPPGYIAGLFDEYAPRFDRHLVETLGYTAPQGLASLIDRLRPAGALDILDLGCGTGLSGAAVAHRARSLTGVDLSPGMVREAAKKNLYTALHAGDMIAFMTAQAQAGRHYDVLLAADVLVYCGDLGPVFGAARPLLSPDGLFVFSVQTTGGEGWVLGMDHRYSYSRPYLEQAAARAGLRFVAAETAILRRDAGQDVSGLLCALVA